MLEKLWAILFGVSFICFVVRLASSTAAASPIIVTIRALAFSEKGMVIIGVFVGGKLLIMIEPAMMLPQASRLMGLITSGLFSFNGDRAENRGCRIEVNEITRKL